MQRWPTVDRELRRRLLDEVRRRQNVSASRGSPAERLVRIDELIAVARAFEGSRSGAGKVASSDESTELWLRMKERFRQADERR